MPYINALQSKHAEPPFIFHDDLSLVLKPVVDRATWTISLAYLAHAANLGNNRLLITSEEHRACWLDYPIRA
ncbi:hypothetical protein N7471_007510 [Penicillium samsonianum]|uniref:uncharacterized protein n=1 Tax=Penicillium samsonianum TaxID=1882272 RepID=UPI00254988F6|nr:uncharacterized protein N7471_007510 [Penicillium samsonianum]KAJ6132295.1 hypothetical protein N7471_007510 [Penicillium samsonianum]